ncbi:MAG: MFS transporter [Chloroflexi bacterium]|nr:MFS transporter [Chloroflexota bacterium]
MLRRTGFAVFGYREYRLFWIAAAFSNIGMWTLVYGRLWLMRTLSDSEILLGSVTAATMAPVMIFSVWGGVVADTVNRLRLLRFTRLLFAVAGFVTAVLIATDTIEAWHLLAISAVTGVMLAFDIPTRGAMVASLVPREQLPSAIALYSVVFGGAAILGPSLFHPLVSSVGMEGLFFIVSASYVLTVLTLLRMDHEPHFAGRGEDRVTVTETGRDSVVGTNQSDALADKVRARVRDMIEGIKFVRRESAIAAIIGYGVIIGIVATPLETLLPVVTQEVYNGDTATYGRLLLAIGIGGLVGTFAITFIGTRSKPPLYLALGGVSVGICYIAFGVVDLLLYALAIAGLVGGLSVVKGTMSTTVVQTLTSDTFRGRVMSLMNFTWGAQAVGALFMGTLAQLWGAPFAFIVAGVMAIVATVVVWRVALRRL